MRTVSLARQRSAHRSRSTPHPCRGGSRTPISRLRRALCHLSYHGGTWPFGVSRACPRLTVSPVSGRWVPPGRSCYQPVSPGRHATCRRPRRSAGELSRAGLGPGPLVRHRQAFTTREWRDLHPHHRLGCPRKGARRAAYTTLPPIFSLGQSPVGEGQQGMGASVVLDGLEPPTSCRWQVLYPQGSRRTSESSEHVPRLLSYSTPRLLKAGASVGARASVRPYPPWGARAGP